MLLKVSSYELKGKTYIENKINSSSWIQELIDGQLKDEEYYLFGENFEEFELIGNTLRSSTFDNRKNPYENVTTRKRKKLMPITFEKRLKELPSIYPVITADQTNKIEAVKKVFDKIVKQVLPTQKKFTIEYNEKNNIYNISEEWIQMKKRKENKIYFDHLKTILKVFLIRQMNWVNRLLKKQKQHFVIKTKFL